MPTVPEGEGLTLGPITVAALPSAVVGPQAAGFKIRVATSGHGLTVEDEYTVVLLRSGNREVLLYTDAQEGSFDPVLYASLLRKVRQRMLVP